jgi:hypothetical protein
MPTGPSQAMLSQLVLQTIPVEWFMESSHVDTPKAEQAQPVPTNLA